jgi:small GTP-binding protein
MPMVTQDQEEQWRLADEQVRRKLPPGVRLLRTLRGHLNTIGRIAWSPDGRMLASASKDTTVRLWDAESGHCLHTLEEHTNWATCVAFAPLSGRMLASGGHDRTVRLWQASDGQFLRCFDGHDDRVLSIAWSPNEKFLASGAADNGIRLWDVETRKRLSGHYGHYGGINDLNWSRNGRYLISGSYDQWTRDWRVDGAHIDWDRMVWQSHTHTAFISSVARSPDGTILATGSDDKSIVIATAKTGKRKVRLEGNTAGVRGISFSANGQILASKGADGSVRFWNCSNWQPAGALDEPCSGWWASGIAFHPSHPILATVGSDPATPRDECDRVIHVWELDFATLLGQRPPATVVQTSAKIVLVGDSNVGKSYLAYRIATGSRPREGTIESTHGMRFWSVDPDRLDLRLSAPKDQRSDLVLWDMGGQEVYRLVHQLFLDDTKVALVLFESVRGTPAFRVVETWNRSLEKQLTGQDAVKLLVGTKLDKASDSDRVDRRGVERLVKDYGFKGYYETSAIAGRGVPELCKAMGEAIDWNSLGWTSRPELFQRIRDEVETRRQGGEVVLHVADLERAVANQDPDVLTTVSELVQELVSQGKVSLVEETIRFDGPLSSLEPVAVRARVGIDYSQRAYAELETRSNRGETELSIQVLRQAIIDKDVTTVTGQLAKEGLLARSKVSTGEPVLVLQIQEIERYAGSLILAARNNARGVPALDLRFIAQADFHLPGIGADRLPRSQEKPVLECTVQLMLEHGICFEHEGLLVFPSLFDGAPEDSNAELPHSVSLYYDFAGAIDNIYASLVAWLVLARDFGKVRLWSDRAEFAVTNTGLCGLRKVSRPGGFAHVDVYFSAKTPERQRQEFISFVEDHLARNSVEIREHIALKCNFCGHDFAEEIVRQRIARGDKDIGCPACDWRNNLIAEGAVEIRRRDADITQHTWALRTQIEKDREQITKQVGDVFAMADEAKLPTEPIRLLHLSDLHFVATTPVPARLQWLLDDLKQNSGLGFSELDYLVISGDFTDKGSAEGFEKAYEFVSELTQEFALSAERCIFVPGNHDVRDMNAAYELRDDHEDLEDGEWIQQGEVILARNLNKYPLRLKPFSDLFYHKFVQRPYPLDYSAQGMVIPFWETGLQFLALNSCWEIDKFHRKRSGLHVQAVANAIKQAQEQENQARRGGLLAEGRPSLRVAVWHHAIAGPEQMRETELIGNLEKNGVRLVLHGDVHEERRDFVGYLRESALRVVGSGSFGATGETRPESTPRLYNVLEISRDLKSARVHTRSQARPDGPWDGWYMWPDPDGGKGRVPYYDINW